MKYVDASAVLRVLFVESGSSVPLPAGDDVVSSRLIEVEAFRAVDSQRRSFWPLPPTANY